MIKANELRIGNYIQGTDYFEFGKVIEIRRANEIDLLDGAEYCLVYEGFGINRKPELFKQMKHTIPERIFGDVTEFDPIPITEEWLFKFGFKKRRYIYKIEIGKNVIGKKAHLTAGQFTYLDSEVFSFYTHSMIQFHHIKYVHQLQNLYFALTGEEL